MVSEEAQLPEAWTKEKLISSVSIGKKEEILVQECSMSYTAVQESSVQNVIFLLSPQIESHDTNVEEHAKDVMTTVVSSIPNIQRFSTMLGTSSLQHCFSKVNLSSIMASSVDSPIHIFSSSFSPAQLITTCQDDIPSVCTMPPEKKDFSICDSFTSLAFNSISCRMNILPVSRDIPLNQT